MQPLIQDGDILEIAPTSARRPLRRRSPVKASNGQILGPPRHQKQPFGGNTTYLIKGDACTQPDGWYDEDAIWAASYTSSAPASAED